jgi:3-phosphoshikimate 1-carboxyvinyltransferase
MLGVQGFATRGNGRPPVVIKGPAQGGLARLEGKVSQFVSSLLINCAFMHRDSHIEVIHVTEKPFIRMTLDWLDRLGIHYRAADDFSAFDVAGGQRITGFETTIPGDFSSATFFLVAASLRSSEITLRGLDMKDTQGDKQVIQFLRQMGADIQAGPDAITVRGGSLKGLELDLGDTPDALPAMAVAGCFAEGRTLIRNVANARLKETDRIAVMAAELTQLGARIKELPDGLEIFESRLHGGPVHGHNDHRVVMALAVAGTAIPGRTEVDTAEAVVVTLPNFLNLMQKLGARIHEEET